MARLSRRPNQALKENNPNRHESVWLLVVIFGQSPLVFSCTTSSPPQTRVPHRAQRDCLHVFHFAIRVLDFGFGPLSPGSRSGTTKVLSVNRDDSSVYFLAASADVIFSCIVQMRPYHPLMSHLADLHSVVTFKAIRRFASPCRLACSMHAAIIGRSDLQKFGNVL